MVAALYCVGFALALAVAVGAVVFLTLLNRSRESYGAPRGMSESSYQWRAEQMLGEAREAIKRSRIPPDRKSDLTRETRDLYDNIVKGVWKLKRVRRIRDLAMKGSASASAAGIAREANDMESRLLDELNRSLDALLAVPASLMKLEMATDDQVVERLIANLDEANLRMKDLADAYDDVRGAAYGQSQAAHR